MGGLADIFKKPSLPKLPDVARLPDTADATVVSAGKRKIREEQATSGRASTDLTSQPPAYGGKDLGL